MADTTADNNTALGFFAGRYISGGTSNLTSNASIYLGYDTRALANGDTNEIVIGSSTIGIGSNSVVLGNSSVTKTALRGQVGVNTTAPSAQLHVSSGANSHVRIGDSTGDTAAYNYLNINYNQASNYGTISAYTSGSAWRNLVLNESGGNVGIGTNAPTSALLQLAAGTASNAQISLIAGADKTGSFNNGDLWYNGTNLWFRTGGANRDLLNSSCSTCLVQVPTTNSGVGSNNVQPATTGVVGLTVNGTNVGAAAVALIVNQNNSNTPVTAMTINQSTNASVLVLNNTAATNQNLVTLTQSNAAYSSTALLMNLGTGTGSFASGNFIDLQTNTASKFKVDYNGAMTIAASSVATSSSINVGALTGATANTALNIGNLSGAGTNTGINIGNLSVGTTNTGIKIGTLTAGAAGAVRGLQMGALTAVASANNFSVDLGAITTVAGATAYGINTGGFTAAAGTAAYGINLGANLSTATTKYGIRVGTISGAGTNSYGLYVDTVSGATNNYAAVFNGGNVGVGTTNPDVNFHVAAAAPTVKIQATGVNAGSYLYFISRLASVDKTAYMYSDWNGDFVIQPQNGRVAINDIVRNSANLSVLGSVAIGSTTYTGAAPPTNGLIVEGNVGIGTNAPGTRRLNVVAGTNDVAIEAVISNTTGNNFGAMFTANGSGATTNTALVANAYGATNNYAALFQYGLVGIGTATPNAPLQVAYDSAGATQAAVALRVTNISGIDGSLSIRVYEDAAGGFLTFGATPTMAAYNISSIVSEYGNGRGGAVIESYNGNMTFWHATGASASTTRSLYLLNTGNVGVGISPTEKLEVAGNLRLNNTGGVIKFNNSGDYTKLGLRSDWLSYYASNATWTGTQWNYENVGGYGGLATLMTNSAGIFDFSTANGGTNPITWNSRLNISNGGNVGLGTTSALGMLDIKVSPTYYGTRIVMSQAAENPQLRLYRTTGVGNGAYPWYIEESCYRPTTV